MFVADGICSHPFPLLFIASAHPIFSGEKPFFCFKVFTLTFLLHLFKNAGVLLKTQTVNQAAPCQPQGDKFIPALLLDAA